MTFKNDIKYLLEFEKTIEQLFEEASYDHRHKAIDRKHVLDYLYSDLYKYAEIIEIIRKECKKEDIIIDIGIAYGFYDIVLSRKYGYKNIVGSDLELHIPIYGKLLKKYGIEVFAGELSEKPLPFGDCEFDFIIFSEVLEHLIILPFTALQEINRILKPGGKLLLATPNIARLSNVIKLSIGKNILEYVLEPDKNTSCLLYDNIVHVREYTMSECIRLLERTGFVPIKTFYSNCWDRPNNLLLPGIKMLNRIVNRMRYYVTYILPRYRSDIVILARKLNE